MKKAIKKRIVALMVLLIFITSSIVYSEIDFINAKNQKYQNMDLIKNNETKPVNDVFKSNETSSEDYVSKLQLEGYKESDIKIAKSFIERLQLQLKEITNDIYLINTNLFIFGEDDTNDLEAYKTLMDSIDFKKALYYLVKLKDEFKSFEAVMDEYLLSLQIGFDFDLYINDKKAYEKDKEDKIRLYDTMKLITMEKIESKMIEMLQQRNNKNTNDIDVNQFQHSLNESNTPLSFDGSSNQGPTAKSILPPDPAADVMKEINDAKARMINP